MSRGATRSFLPLASAEDAAAADDDMGDQQWGRQVTLPLPTTQGPSVENWGPWLQGPEVDVVWGIWKAPTHATIILQTSSLPSGGVADPIAGIYVRVRVSLGGSAHFTRKFKLIAGPAYTLRVFGRGIHVSAFAVDNGNPPAMALAGAITLGDTNPLGEIVPVWADEQTCRLGGVHVGEGNLMRLSGASHSGYLLSVMGYTNGTMLSGNPYYFQVFDLTPSSAIANGTPALVEIGPLIGPGPCSFGFDRSLRPSVRFLNGLMWGMSTTSLTYTTSGVDAIVQADYGL